MKITYTATYDPADNKIRLRASSRLDAETYARVRAAGFIWAPKQELFVAPMWTPERADLAEELAGEIEDEDTTLVERAEERADRFGDYSGRCQGDADNAHAAVRAIADHIPFGQPILVGHHSERRARKDAERIQNGMRKAIHLWEQSKYWEERAKGALRHAKYKERPDVRARRIKGLEADLRKQEKNKKEAETWLELWSKEGLTHPQALQLANYCHLYLPRKEGDREGWSHTPSAWEALREKGEPSTIYAPRTLEEVIASAKAQYPRTIERAERWIAHLTNRLAYERAMLDEAGGLVGEKHNLEVGGEVFNGRLWCIVTKLNKKDGKTVSVSTNNRTWPRILQVEEIRDYRAPSAEQVEQTKAATKTPPLCNYPGEGFAHITKAQWEALPKQYRGTGARETSEGSIKAGEQFGRHRVRCALGTFLWKYVKDSIPEEERRQRFSEFEHSYAKIFITDEKRKDPPKADQQAPRVTLPAPEQDLQAELARAKQSEARRQERAIQEAADKPFQDLKDSLKGGVKTVCAPQLFPTPDHIARRMVELAGIQDGDRVLEPSAGTGSLLRALKSSQAASACVYAVELSYTLASRLGEHASKVVQRDFMECTSEELGGFNRVLMNPPFENGKDVKHILHAYSLLFPGGRLVAICANGPRQQEALKPLASSWEVLPSGTFAGTSIRSVLLAIDKPAEAQAAAA